MYASELNGNLIRPSEIKLKSNQQLYADNETRVSSAKSDLKLMRLIRSSERLLTKVMSNKATQASMYSDYLDKLSAVSNLLKLGQDLRFNNDFEKEYFNHLLLVLKQDGKKTKTGKVFNQDFYELLSFIYKYSYLLYDTSEVSLVRRNGIQKNDFYYTCSSLPFDSPHYPFIQTADESNSKEEDQEYKLPMHYIVFLNTISPNGRPIENLSAKWSKYREQSTSKEFYGKTTPTLQKFSRLAYYFWVEDGPGKIVVPKKMLDFDEDDPSLHRVEKGFYTADEGYQYLFPTPIYLSTTKHREITRFLQSLQDEKSSRVQWLYFRRIVIVFK
jgi:hypothetical protein